MFTCDTKFVEVLKNRYHEGTRVELISMNDKQAPPEGTQGTVVCVDDIGTVHVDWDNGQYLGVIYGEDFIRKI